MVQGYKSSVEFPTFSVTPHGVLAHMRMLEHSPGRFVALLSCYDSIENDAELGLSLVRCPLQPAGFSPPVYCIDGQGRIARIPDLGLPRGSSFEWKDVYLVHRPPPGTEVIATDPHILADHTLSAPFRFWQLEKLLRRDVYHLRSIAQTSWPDSATSRSTMSLTFASIPSLLSDKLWHIIIHLGRCTLADQRNSLDVGADSPHWAYMEFLASPSRGTSSVSMLPSAPSHQCSSHHIRDWSLGTKFFGIPEQLVTDIGLSSFRLFFTPCPMNPSKTLVVHLLPQTVSDSLSLKERALKEIVHEVCLFRGQLLDARRDGRGIDVEDRDYQQLISAFRPMIDNVSTHHASLSYSEVLNFFYKAEEPA
jgi:hypothetical protein